jgi:hypothetical protein
MATLAVSGSVWLPTGQRLQASGTTTVQPPMLVGVDNPDVAATVKAFPGVRIIRVFGSPGKGIPAWSSTQMKACVANGVLPHVSFKDAPTAALVNPWMDAIPAGVKVWLTWHHEPEGDLPPADYAAAWATLAQLVAAHPKHGQVTTVGILTYYAETHGKGPWQTWVTGHEQMLGMDMYVTIGSALPTSVAFFAILDQIAAVTGKPVCVPELGAQPTTAGYAAWLTSCLAYGRQRGYRAMSVWNTMGTNGVNYSLSGAALTDWQQGVAAQ